MTNIFDERYFKITHKQLMTNNKSNDACFVFEKTQLIKNKKRYRKKEQRIFYFMNNFNVGKANAVKQLK